jgi:hypothetical protein
MRSFALAGCAASLLMLAGCAHATAEQGGVTFRQAAIEAPRGPLEKLLEVCWPADASPVARLTFTRVENEWMFEAKTGASNSTGRCARELLLASPHASPPSPLELKPPAGDPSGWAVLEYVRLLSASRFDEKRGLLDPAVLVSACLKRGMGLRRNVRFDITHAPALKVHVLGEGGEFAAVTDTERCVEAVLGATAWPTTRAFRFGFAEREGMPDAAGDVEAYFAPSASAPAGIIEPQVVRDAFQTRAVGVGVCWESALARRAGLSGARSVRLAVTPEGAVSSVTIVANVSNQAITAADHLLDACLLQVVRGVRFPPGGGGAVYSWVFADRAAQ